MESHAHTHTHTHSRRPSQLCVSKSSIYKERSLSFINMVREDISLLLLITTCNTNNVKGLI